MAAIERCFITKKGVASHLIEVTTRRGVVELTDSLGSAAVKHRTECLAYELEARNVNNHVQGRPLAQPQAALAPVS